MAKLPTRDDLPQALPSVTRQISTPSVSRVGAEISRLGGAMGGVAQVVAKEQDQMDDIRVEDAINKAKMSALELSKGDNGFVHVRGDNVVGKPVREDYSKRYKKSMDDIEKGLSPSQVPKFRRRQQPLNINFQGSLISHIGNEAKAYQEQTDAATIDIETQSAAANYNSPSLLKESKDRILYTINSKAEREGLSGKEKKQIKNDELTKFHKNVIAATIETDPSKASEYYEANKKEINGVDQVGIENALRTGSVKAESQSTADSIMEKDLSLTDALKDARKTKNADVREATVDLVKERYTEKKSAETAAINEAGLYVAENHSLENLDPEIMKLLPADKITSLQKSGRTLRQGVQPIQNHRKWAEFNSLVGKASAGDKASIQELYSKDIFNDLYMDLDNSHYDQALSMQRAFVTNDAKEKNKAGNTAGQVLTNRAATDRFINQILDIKKSSGKGGRGKEDERFADEFYQLSQTAIDQWSVDNPKKKIPANERDAILSGLAESVMVEDGGFMYFDKDFNVSDIPPEHINEIAAELRKEGYQLTGQNIINEYLARKEQGLIE